MRHVLTVLTVAVLFATPAFADCMEKCTDQLQECTRGCKKSGPACSQRCMDSNIKCTKPCSEKLIKPGSNGCVDRYGKKMRCPSPPSGY